MNDVEDVERIIDQLESELVGLYERRDELQELEEKEVVKDETIEGSAQTTVSKASPPCEESPSGP